MADNYPLRASMEREAPFKFPSHLINKNSGPLLILSKAFSWQAIYNLKYNGLSLYFNKYNEGDREIKRQNSSEVWVLKIDIVSLLEKTSFLNFMMFGIHRSF